MRLTLHRRIFTILLVLAVHLMCTTSSFAANSQLHKSSWPNKHNQLDLDANRLNRDILVNGNNIIQLVNVRTPKTGHFTRILFMELFSFIACLKYLKTKLKSINSGYVRFLKLLLFPEHVFW